MSIFLNLKKAHAAVVVDNLKNPAPELSKNLRLAAIAAINGGIESEEWKKYMSLFANNDKELARLTTPQDGDGDYMPQFRAYVVSNSVCDASTDTRTPNKVDGRIDIDPADSAEDPAFIATRPFPIPAV
jgi:hypothetical protein